MIKLMDIIRLSGITLHKFKIHCATGVNPSPLDAFLEGRFKHWQECQNQQNFKCDEIVSLIHRGGDKWLFAGVYAVEGVQPRAKGDSNYWAPEGLPHHWFEYSTRELEGLDDLTGRVIVQFDKNFRASYLIGNKHAENILVSEIRDQRISIKDFPGYRSVLLAFHLLVMIVQQNLVDWKTALSNVPGVYIITDKKAGKYYIGSAYGDEGIWQRWCAYAKDGHGGNKELKKLLQNKSEHYANNFQIAILEVCDLNISNEEVIKRESHWKDVLCTREFGYNSN